MNAPRPWIGHNGRYHKRSKNGFYYVGPTGPVLRSDEVAPGVTASGGLVVHDAGTIYQSQHRPGTPCDICQVQAGLSPVDTEIERLTLLKGPPGAVYDHHPRECETCGLETQHIPPYPDP